MTKKRTTGGFLPIGRRIEMGLVKRPKTLTPSRLARMEASRQKSIAEELATRPLYYPDPELFPAMDEEAVKALGFRSKSETSVLDGIDQIGFHDFEDFALGLAGKGKAPNKKNLPDPKVVAGFVKKRVSALPLADATGPLRVYSQNFEFLTPDKVKYFAESYKAMFPYFHVVTATEVSPDGAAAMCKLTGMEHFASGDNTRGGQAVVIFYDPKRLKPDGKPVLIDEVANVQGVADLRPMLWVTLVDKVTGKKHRFGVNHLKSMRGGPQATGIIRRQQCEAIIRGLPKGWDGFIGGDWNCRLQDGWGRIDLKPLFDDGFILVDEKVQKLPTHVMGGWLDAFIIRSTETVSGLVVIQWFLDSKRDLTDHACVGINIG